MALVRMVEAKFCDRRRVLRNKRFGDWQPGQDQFNRQVIGNALQ